MSSRLFKARRKPVLPKRKKGVRSTSFAREALFAGFGKSPLPAGGFDFDQLGRRDGAELPPTVQLLTDGGDARIVCGPGGSNRYGCSSLPQPDVLAYGSSTASTISAAGFAAADILRDRLQSAAAEEPPHVTYERELDRVRRELAQLCGLGDLSGLETIFGASGTDLHLFASQLMVDAHAPAPLIVRVEAGETGRGVPDALAGRHFSDCAALGDAVVANAPLDCGRPIDILEVKCRAADGRLRPQAAVDDEVEAAVIVAAATGRRILLTLVDVSKTGILAPSPAIVDALRRRFPKSIEVLVDACQFRLAPSTLKAYLEHDFLVAITGSKFITGPTFCGALFVPRAAAQRLRARTLPRALKSYSAQAEWPRHWAARTALRAVENYGLLLRWEAALTELRAFRRLPEAAIADFLQTFARAVTKHLSRDPAFELLPMPRLNRAPLARAESWDCLPTIFSFLLRKPSASGKNVWLNPDETKKVHELLREDQSAAHAGASQVVLARRCQVGQPVGCGNRDGIPVSALRLCASSRLILDALSPKGRGPRAVIADAIAVLDKAALLASLPTI
jgi:hypothetical protein